MILSIIQATLAYLEDAARLFDGYRQFYKQAPDLDACRQFLSNRLSQQESTVFLAYLDDEAVGFMQLYPTFESVSLGKLWILNDLYVAPTARQRGVGEALLKRSAQLGRKTGAKRLSLQTDVNNIPAQSLYEKMGWERDTQFYSYDLVTRSSDKV